jgi:hypothetical protein
MMFSTVHHILKNTALQNVNKPFVYITDLTSTLTINTLFFILYYINIYTWSTNKVFKSQYIVFVIIITWYVSKVRNEVNKSIYICWKFVAVGIYHLFFMLHTVYLWTFNRQLIIGKDVFTSSLLHITRYITCNTSTLQSML